MRMIRLKVFVGYQIKSVYHRPSVYRKLIDLLNRELQKSSPQVQLQATFGEFPPGTNLWNEITAALLQSDLTVFDISENNRNVMVEVGIAVGGNKHVILLKSTSSNRKYPAPSDLRGFIYQPYDNGGDLISAKRVLELSSSILHYVNDAHADDFYLKSIWALKPDSPTLIVPGVLPPSRTGNKFEDYVHLRKYSDLDAMMIAFDTLNHLYPRMDVSVESYPTVSALPKKWADANIVLIGGPGYNPLVSDLGAKCPIEYKGSEDNIWLRHKVTGQKWKPSFNKVHGKMRATDHGFLYKRTLNGGQNKLVMLGGARTWGVYGAAALIGFSSASRDSDARRRAKEIVRRFGSDPSLLIPVQVEGSRDGISVVDCDYDCIEVLA